MNTKTKNESIVYQRVKYEIIWLSELAKHVLDNYFDPFHQINHEEIEDMLLESDILEFKPKSELFVAVGEHNKKTYSTYIRLHHKSKRCVILSCYIDTIENINRKIKNVKK